MKNKVMLVFGTRPEAIKLAPLYWELKSSGCFEVTTCVTAQHRQMLYQVLNTFDIKPDIDLNLMLENQNLLNLTSNILLKMNTVLSNHRPNHLIVHGDTTTTMSSALAAFYLKINICHVEAGLRTYNLYSPFPEEANRQIVSRIANIHYAPTNKNKTDLISEGINENNIVVTGNTVIDALLLNLKNIDSSSIKKNKINKFLSSILGFNWNENKYILVTAHRRENFGENFRNIFKAIKELASKYPIIKFIYPVHPNPNVKHVAFEIFANISNIILINPLGYEEFSVLMKHCHFIMTDSGGIQEEAPSLGKPVLVFRNNTERPEAIFSGSAKLVGSSISNIINEASNLIDNRENYKLMTEIKNPYGDGTASKKIVEHLKKIL